MLYSKANWEDMKSDMKSLHAEIVSDQLERDPTTDELWNKFCSAYENSVKTHVPTKTASPKDKKPWITAEIKKKKNQKTISCPQKET